MRRLYPLLLALMAIMPGPSGALSMRTSIAEVEYIHPGDEWRYSPKDYVPEECTGPEIDDRGWAVGRAPFSNQKTGDFAYRTYWPEATTMWLRKSVQIPAATDLQVYMGIDDGYELYCNGVLVTRAFGGGTSRWSVSTQIPRSLVVRGRNVIALRVIDSGALNGFDMRLVSYGQTLGAYERTPSSPVSYAPMPGRSRGRYIRPGDTWRYTSRDLPPAVCTRLDYIDRGWKSGRAPFSTVDRGHFKSATYWPLNTTMWVRKTLNVPQRRVLRAYVGADNGFEMYWNGVLIRKELTSPAYRWNSVFDVPESIVRPGNNVIAVKLFDYGGWDGFDMKLEDSPGLPRTASTLYNPANGHYYMGMGASTGITWYDANIAAQSSVFLWMKGHLATITSREESDFISQGIGRFPQVGSWWLGGYQPFGSPEPAGGWTWVDGEPFSFTNWATNEPSNGGNAEDAVELRPDGHWNDRLMSETNPLLGYILEFEPGTAMSKART